MSTEDFLCILINFLDRGKEPDSCCTDRSSYLRQLVTDRMGKRVGRPGSRLQETAPTDISVAELDPDAGSTQPFSSGLQTPRGLSKTPKVGMLISEIAADIGVETAVAADLDQNGVVDAFDVAEFADVNGIVLPERFQAILREQANAAEHTAPPAIDGP